MKVSVNIVPLEVTPALSFLISYSQEKEHGELVNL
jgi:hypothetical protein